MKVTIAYEDSWILIVNKPSGLLTIPAPNKKNKTLTQILNRDLEKDGISYRLHPCHRLDRGTSGLVIFAKGKSVQQKMMQQFKNRKVKKKYIAFVQGRLSRANSVIKSRIEGRSALTRYRLVRQEEDFAVVEINPLTGRKNQIRIHFKLIRHPLVGEDKFAFRKDFLLKCKRLCLHAKSLEFAHPVTKEHIFVNSPLPGELKEFLNRNQ